MVAQDGIIAVYIMASGKHRTLYIGVTSDLARRAWEHREGIIAGFTKKHACKRLVWWKQFEAITAAIQAEKTMKRWVRGWKIDTIERDNPHWDDLYGSWLGAPDLAKFEGLLAAAAASGQDKQQSSSPSGLTRGSIVSNGADNPQSFEFMDRRIKSDDDDGF